MRCVDDQQKARNLRAAGTAGARSGELRWIVPAEDLPAPWPGAPPGINGLQALSTVSSVSAASPIGWLSTMKDGQILEFQPFMDPQEAVEKFRDAAFA